MDDFDKLQILVSQYLKAHPKAQNPFDFFISYGTSNLLSILKEANGMKVIFVNEDGEDKCSYSHEQSS